MRNILTAPIIVATMSICIAILLLTFPQGGRAQDQFDSGGAPNMTAEQALDCARQRLLHYGDEPFKQPSVCPPVTLKGGVSIDESGTPPDRPTVAPVPQSGSAGIFGDGSLPQRGGAGVFGGQTPPGTVLQGGAGMSGGSGTATGNPEGTVLRGGVSQGQQGPLQYPPPTASGVDPVFRGRVQIGKVTYTIQSEGQPGGAGWGPFTNPDRQYDEFYGQVEQRESAYIFRITALRRGNDTQFTNIEVPVSKIR